MSRGRPTSAAGRPSFTCPRCGRTSWHPVDVAEGYCGRCHDWTGVQRRVADPFGRDEHVDRPGLRVHSQPIDAAGARQMTFVGTESSAVHSRSKGWLPMVALTLAHVPLVGEGVEQRLMLMLGRTDVELLIEHLQGALTGAIADAEKGLIEDP